MSRFALLLGLMLNLFCLPLWAVTDAQATTYDFSTLDVPGATNINASNINASGQVAGSYDSGLGSLRQAILDANAATGDDTLSVQIFADVL